MKPLPFHLALLTLAWSGTLCPAAAAPALGCLIEPDRIAEVGSPVVAVIESVEVDRGQSVRKGQVLVTLRATVERAAADAARSRAEANSDLEAAATNASFNRERAQRAEDLFRKSFISQQALDQARTEAQLAEQKLSQTKEQKTVTAHERDMAEAQLSQRVIRSPIDGVVAERYVSAGERADDKPLLRIARIDPLRVLLVVPTTLYGRLQHDAVVHVVPDLPGARPQAARVTMVDKVVDPASNTFRVQLSLPNPDLSLPAGLRCKADFGPLSPADAADAATRPVSPWAGRTAQPATARPAPATPAIVTAPARTSTAPAAPATSNAAALTAGAAALPGR